MDERILIRGEISWWVHFFRVVSGLAVVVGIGLLVAGLPAGWFVAGPAALLSVILEVVSWKARRDRAWLILQAAGFELEDRSGRRTVRDVQITAAALETKRNLRNGEYHSLTRKFRVWTDDRSDEIVMENTILANQSDSLADLINRLLDGLIKRFEEALQRGGAVVGDGWQLTRTALTLGQPPNETQLALSDVTAVDLFDGKMCVWRRGQDEACAKLPLAGRNVHLLPLLVRSRIPEQADVGGAESASGLGRVLFQRQPGAGVIGALFVIGGILAVLGLVLGVAGAAQGDKWPLWLMIPGGLVLAAIGLVLKFSNFRCHERGVWQSNIFGQKMLRYTDIGSFTYGATRHYHNGAYTGTHLSMHFKPALPQGGAPISFSTTVQGDDDDLDELRNFISQAIAARMGQQLAAGQPVGWTPNLQFHPQGIAYRPAGMFGRKEFEMLTFENYAGHNLNQGVFFLFARGNPKPVASEQCSSENFFPGWFLLMKLEQPSEGEQQAAT